MHKTRSLAEFTLIKLEDDTFASSKIDSGFSLVFCFACNYGKSDTFKKDKNIFNL